MSYFSCYLACSVMFDTIFRLITLSMRQFSLHIPSLFTIDFTSSSVILTM